MDILKLSQFNIQSIRENAYDFQIEVISNSPPSICPHCGRLANLQKHGNRDQICMDLPIDGKRVELLIKRQRYRCRCCDRTFWERMDNTIDEKRSCTKRLLIYVEKQSLKRTFVSISDDVGLNEKTVRSIFRDYINRNKEKFRFETPHWLGIDDMQIIKPRCVLTNLEEHTLLDVLPNRNKDNLVAYLIRLANKERIAGHRVIRIDLPGHGKDQTPISEVSLTVYTDRVVAAIDELDQEVILVGHNMGGIVVSQAAEYRPNRIKSLVYLTAFLLQNGQNMLVIPANPNMLVSKDERTINVPTDKAKQTFYNNCLDADAAGAVSRLQEQATSPFMTPLSLTQNKFGQVPRYYIEGL
jgi:transposase-like protein